MKNASLRLLSCLILSLTAVRADQVIPDDLLITNNSSLGVGFDIVNGEAFGDDTIRLKENNTRIAFIDTSNSASFPSTDWQLRANESTNGGRNEFAIDDLDSGWSPFAVEAGARDDALVVDTSGNVGLGSSAPAKSLHILGDDTPTVRLDQGTGSGLTAQVWDVSGNEAGFQVQDITNSAQIPFRVRSGAPTHALTVGVNGVGVGVDSATVEFHVRQIEDLQTSLIENTHTTAGARTVLQLRNNGPAGLRISNTNGAATPSDWDLTVTDAGELVISLGGVPKITIDATGNLTAAGTVSDASDVHVKEAFAPVDASGVLDKVAGLPLSTWRYKGEEITHIGPMAQDFHAAFAVGANDTTIAKTDADGVALASIQALHADARAKDRRIEELTQQNLALEARLNRLEELMEAR